MNKSESTPSILQQAMSSLQNRVSFQDNFVPAILTFNGI